MNDFEQVRKGLQFYPEFDEDIQAADEASAALDRIEAEVERLRVSEAEAWEKSGAWHKLLQGQVCGYCREPLLSGTGPPCQHQKQLQRASLAHSKAEGAVAEVERLRTLVDKQLIPAQREVERLRAERVRLMFGRDAEVERLRGQRDVSIEQGQFHARKSEEGWSEVERLRTELGEVGDLEGEIERLRAENENEKRMVAELDLDNQRLRATLERIARTDPRDNVTGKYLIGFARNALAGEKV